MLVFPNCKINLGLYVTDKRNDGYHNIETVFYPVQWTDALEIIENTNSGAERFSLHWSNQSENIPLDKQLLYKAWQLVTEIKALPPIDVYFHKTIPFGAGLGGGSSDGAHMIELLDQKFQLQLSQNQKLNMASRLGSDCAFFILNKPQLATGKGDELKACSVNLSQYFLCLVYPEIHCNTALAYKSVQAQKGRPSLQKLIEQTDFSLWKKELINDFEKSVFKKHPIIASIKNRMYDLGAEYASMSGSGSTVYGIFKSLPDLTDFKKYRCFLQEPGEKVF